MTRRINRWIDDALVMMIERGAGNAEIAETLDVSLQTIGRRRKVMGIPDRSYFSDDEIKALGVGLDREVAAALGRSVTSVKEARIRRGIPAFAPTSPAADGLVGRDWYYERSAGARLRVIADRAGRSITTIRAGIERYRARRGLPVIVSSVGRRRRSRPVKTARDHFRIDWTRYDALLGTMPDTVIAALAGCQPQTVLARRQRTGISPFPVTELTRNSA